MTLNTFPTFVEWDTSWHWAPAPGWEHLADTEVPCVAQTSDTGDRDAFLSPSHRQAIDDLCISRAERDEALYRARRAAQILIAEFGADGPTNVDEAAERAVRVAAMRKQEAVEQECAAVVDRICAAVRREYCGSVDRVHMGTTYIGCTADGPKFVQDIHDEIRKAAKG